MLKNAQKDFIQRHIGPSKEEQKVMLKELGYNNLDELIAKTVPEKILLKENLSIGEPNSEYKALRKLRDISQKNKIYSNFIGMGYYGNYTPYVILRNILENLKASLAFLEPLLVDKGYKKYTILDFLKYFLILHMEYNFRNIPFQ